MGSHGLPPPPASYHRPDHVAAARRSASCSNGFDGSPGTMYVFHASAPFDASYAETKPRTAYSEPALPIRTFPPATRGAPVMAYGPPFGVVCTDHTGVPVLRSSARSRPSIVPTYTLSPYRATPRF